MDLVKYAKSILARRSEAVTLKRATASIGDWKPQAHRCHENVRAWVQRNPHHKQVFGYVLFNFGILGQRVMAHSAVEDENGDSPRYHAARRVRRLPFRPACRLEG